MSVEENKKKLLAEMDTLMRSLRQCDTQAAAIGWMTRAYDAMDGVTRLVADMDRMLREEASQQRGLIFRIPKPTLEIVQTVPKVIAHRQPAYEHPIWLRGTTVVYPEVFLPPGSQPSPRAWTQKDTRRLEAASKMGRQQIVKKGR